ncbi:WD domain, G-beta repeat protein [Teladorsagia circumcincta]|uniref:WD domain, G-beta repeat protein n=1 Tax=Teladorsagia circumcincta TaxID=45464 RepID=A0A2G9UIK9_TELCI|nr:WD domain, G-beta repeat protein [Teladorsagia circumcincta]
MIIVTLLRFDDIGPEVEGPGCSRMIDISNPSSIPPDDPDHPFIPSKTVYDVVVEWCQNLLCRLDEGFAGSLKPETTLADEFGSMSRKHEQHRQPIYACAFNPYQPDGCVPVLATAVKNMEQHRQPIYACAFNPYQPDGCVPVLATAAKNMITIYECPLDSNKIVLVRSIKDPSPDMDIFTLTWCYDITDKAHRIAFGGYSGLIRLVDPSSGNLLMNMYGHGDHVNEMRTDPNNSMIFASVSKDTTIRLWNIRVHGPIAILGGYEGHKDQILSLGSDMSMVVFRFGSFGEEFYKIRPKLQVDTSALQLVRMDLPDSDIWFIKFDIDPLNRWIVSGNKMGQLCMWDLTDGLPAVNMIKKI